MTIEFWQSVAILGWTGFLGMWWLERQTNQQLWQLAAIIDRMRRRP